jgi:hypothetical protein
LPAAEFYVAGVLLAPSGLGTNAKVQLCVVKMSVVFTVASHEGQLLLMDALAVRQQTQFTAARHERSENRLAKLPRPLKQLP